MQRLRSLVSASLAIVALCDCGGGGGGGPATFSIGGTITGLTAAGLVLANGTDTASPAAGTTSFTFATALTSGSSYAVTVKTQPNSELCQVANGNGQVGSAAVTNVVVTCKPATYTIGGTITGLTAVGLVLANGTDTASPAAGATSFTFPTALASGSNYAVTIKTQPLKGVCQVANGSGQVPNASVMNVMVTCTRDWVWLNGSSTVGAKGVYGTRAMAAAGNVPGARRFSVSWTDSVGDLWLFGGAGYDSAGTWGYLNDVWRYSPGSNQWTWVSGSNTVGAQGVYGTQGMAAASNVPGARQGSVSWTHSSGDVWLFGGAGYDSAGNQGYLNDLWRYSPGSGQWTWVGGSNTVNAKGVYGTVVMAAPGNVPGARESSVSWTDSAGDLWLFGGLGLDSAGTAFYLNDLWRYSPGSNQWTWLSGSNTVGAQGVYGTQGMAAPGNVPGAREGSVSWTDSAGDLWLLGGRGGWRIYLNDLWRYSAGTGQWIWVGGSNKPNATVSSVPGARWGSVSWTDSAEDLWLFGGVGSKPTGPPPGGVTQGGFNDLWRYSVDAGQWTLVSGSTTANAQPVYGTQGVAAAANVPGARLAAISWIDSAGSLWLFGGNGFDSAGTWGDLNDLWVY